MNSRVWWWTYGIVVLALTILNFNFIIAIGAGLAAAWWATSRYERLGKEAPDGAP